MIAYKTKSEADKKPAKKITGTETVLGCVVIGCFIIGISGVFGVHDSRDAGTSLLASAVAFAVIAYIYSQKHCRLWVGRFFRRLKIW
jgi:hypothetical protein